MVKFRDYINKEQGFDPQGLRVLLELNSSDTRIGAVNDALDLAHFVGPMGARYFFCGAVDEGLAALAQRSGVSVLPGKSRMISRIGLPLFALNVIFWIIKFLRYRPHIVHLNYAGYGPSLAFASFLWGIPVVARAGSYDPRNWANRWIRAYVANGEAHAQPLHDSPLADRVFIAGDLFRPERLTEITNLERPFPPSTGLPRFLFLGQLVERKGIAVLLKAFAVMKESADLLLVGGNWEDLGYPKELCALIDQLKLKDRVYLENHRTDVGMLLHECDVFVLPSLSEARPRSIIEAMCMGLPIISTRVGGIPSLIEDGVTGLLVPPSNVEALATALDRLARSEDTRRQFGQSAFARARVILQPEQTAKRYLSLYRSLIVSGSLPRS